jgi:uncharacterized membrane protein
MTPWLPFALSMTVFLLAHAIPTRPRVKAALVARLGAAGFGIGYSLLSTGLLVWVIVAAGRAPYLPLWGFGPTQAVLALVLMLLACLLTGYAIAGRNPLSFGSRAAPFDPGRPGIAGVSRHPVLLALALWAVAHLIANGDLAHVVLFGVMGVFALAGMPLIDRRKRRQMGADWTRLAAATSGVPLAALVSGRWHPRGAPPLAPGLAGLAVWGALLVLHAPVIGVDPLALLR